MHLNKIIALIVLTLMGCGTTSNVVNTYDYTPVLLHLDSDKQHDSIGFNIVTAIPELLYSKLLTGDLALWENSSKQVIVGATDFAEREKKAYRPFVRNTDLFIHEYWKLYHRTYDFGIEGFSFTGETVSGTRINYGYVDMRDIINLLRTEEIPTNANGSSNLTYWEALNSKTFDFNLVSFGKNTFKRDPAYSVYLKEDAIHNPKVNRDLHSIQPVKDIAYTILSPEINSNPKNATIYQTIEAAINKNKQTVLNTSNDSFFLENIYKTWTIDNISIEEEWQLKNGLPFQKFKSLSVFLEQREVTFTQKEIDEMGIRINFQGFIEYISEKSFSFILQSINIEEIKPTDSEKMYEALLTKPWNHIK